MDALARHKARKTLIEALTPTVESIEFFDVELGPGIVAHLAELCLTTLIAIDEAQDQLRRDQRLDDEE